MNSIRNRYLILTGILLMLAGIMVACSSDSPTTPTQQPTNPPGTAPPNSTWNITVTPSPTTIEQSGFGDETSLISVRVVSAADGSPPPNDTTIQLTTTLGSFDRLADVEARTATLVGGSTQVTLYADFSFDRGVAIVQAQLEQSYGSAEVRIIGSEAPFISHLEPAVGRPEGGYQVNIIGGGFVPEITVVVGGTPAEVTGADDGVVRIRMPPATVPAGQTRVVDVTVNTGQGTPTPKTVSLASAFTYAYGGDALAPQVFSITPSQGPNEGGYQAVIRGANFEAPSQVQFGDNPEFVEATIVSIRSNEIVVVVPAAVGFGQVNENETVDVTIRSLNTGLSGVLTDGFTYGHGGGDDEMFISSMGPTQGPIGGGQLVTIYGFGFKEPVSASFGSLAQQVISVSGTEVVVRTVAPQRANCGDLTFSPVSVVNIETNESASAAITYTYLAPDPILLGVSPASGVEAGGNTVTLSGVNFESPAVVQFGGSSALLTTVVSSTTTTAVVPPYTGTLNTEACDDNGDGTLGERYLPTSVNVTWDNPLYTGCSTTLTNGYTYNPADTSCRNDDAPAPPPGPADPVAAGFIWSLTGNAGEVQFSNASSGPVTGYTWIFRNGTPGSANTAGPHLVTFAAGTHLITLTVTGDDGQLSEVSEFVTVP